MLRCVIREYAAATLRFDIDIATYADADAVFATACRRLRATLAVTPLFSR